MSARSVASVLTDFTPKHVPADRVTVFTASPRDRNVPVDDDAGPAEAIVDIIDYELKVKDAFAAGRESGQAEAAVLFEAEKVRLEREFQDQLAAADALFLEQTGSKMATQISEGLAAIAAELCRNRREHGAAPSRLHPPQRAGYPARRGCAAPRVDHRSAARRQGQGKIAGAQLPAALCLFALF